MEARCSVTWRKDHLPKGQHPRQKSGIHGPQQGTVIRKCSHSCHSSNGHVTHNFDQLAGNYPKKPLAVSKDKCSRPQFGQITNVTLNLGSKGNDSWAPTTRHNFSLQNSLIRLFTIPISSTGRWSMSSVARDERPVDLPFGWCLRAVHRLGSKGGSIKVLIGQAGT